LANPQEVTDTDFETLVLQSPLPALVDFWAPWCGPCRMVAPIVEELAQEYEGQLAVFKVNTDDNFQTAARYGIHSIPTLLIFKDGKLAEQVVGFRPKAELRRRLEQVLAG